MGAFSLAPPIRAETVLLLDIEVGGQAQGQNSSSGSEGLKRGSWAMRDSNARPMAPEAIALSN